VTPDEISALVKRLVTAAAEELIEQQNELVAALCTTLIAKGVLDLDDVHALIGDANARLRTRMERPLVPPGHPDHGRRAD
jgi:hypothetical protein